MRHQVKGARSCAVDMSRPYSDGATYSLAAGAEAVVLLRGRCYEVRNTAQTARCFNVTHHGGVDAHSDPMVEVVSTDVL